MSEIPADLELDPAHGQEVEPGPSPYADPDIDTDGPQDEVPA